ncbi:MAG: hypothetical protein PVG32_17580 [Anaerolineales bacterium]
MKPCPGHAAPAAEARPGRSSRTWGSAGAGWSGEAARKVSSHRRRWMRWTPRAEKRGDRPPPSER